MERRFAIVIGINDYSSSPLNYCVNDAKVITENLIKSCNFEQKDIYLITSSSEISIKDITGRFESALQKISENLISEKDSILFYFAGHGEYYNSNSGIYFQDSFTEIKFIFEKINNLNPKYQCYIIDACESGGKVLTRKNESKDNISIIDKYISNSTGVLFMYASTQNEFANEISNLEHGLFTHYFIKSIQNIELYDEDGILTPNRIQDYIVRQTLKESQFSQTPVIENRTIGYYPFAFLNKIEENPINKNPHSDITSNNQEIIIDKEYFPVIPSEIRNQLFDYLSIKINDSFEKHLNKFIDLDYETIIGENFSIFNSDIEEKLTDSIVSKSVKKKVFSIENLFDSEREIIKPNPFTAGFLNSFLNKNDTEYRYTNYIRWHNPNLISKSLSLKSKTIKKVDVGFAFIIYQSLYGIGVATSSFYLDYNGYTNEIIKGPFTEIYPYKYNANTINLIISCLESEFNLLVTNIESWNYNRVKTINEFDERTK